MKILLTGASSYVGARLFLDLYKTFEVIGTYHGTKLSEKFIQLDTTSPEDVKKIVDEQKPDVIVHAAANANAKWCETHPDEARQLNQQSTESIVSAANNIGAKVILLSSFVAIDPVNVYGQTKAASEEMVKNTKKGYVILRPSLIVGFSPNTTNDRPFNRILKNLDEHTEAIYDTSWKFQPTYLHHISEVIEKVLEENTWDETIHIAVRELKSRYDIAKDILSPFGISVTTVDNHDTTPVTTDNLESLEKLHLPQYSYPEIIENIVEEIKHRDRYSHIE